ncbi:MAG: iron-containing alcohol dehydrogenase [Myxococcota bacterium]
MIRPRSIENLRLERVHLGVALAEAVKAEADDRGAERVVVVASKTLSRETSILDPVESALGSRHAGRFHETREHVPRDGVLDLARFLRERRADLVLTIGGGTPIDTVKMALLCLAEDVHTPADLDRFAVSVREDGSRHTPDVASPPLRQIAAPTTLSGAEFSDLSGCVDSETRTKQLFSGREIGPAAVVLDPTITLATPMPLWLSTGVRAIDHAVETLCSSAPEPVADAGALESLRLLGRSLPRTAERPDDLEARLDSQMGVWLACAGLNRVPYGASHGIGHQLGAVAAVPHGYTSCVMLPHVLDFNAAHTNEAQQRIADALGSAGSPAGDVVRNLVAELGLPSRLREVGVERHHFEAIAAGAMANAWVRANPRPVETAGEITGLLEHAY